MRKFGWFSDDECGKANSFLVTTIIFVFLAVGLGVGFGWAYTQMTDYRDNVNSKINVAVTEARKAQKKVDDKQFAEEYKKPNTKFQGPSDSGSVSFDFPKTWSVYASRMETGGGNMDIYFNPQQVPSINSKTAYALRVSLSDKTYDSVLKSYQSKIKKGILSAEPITIARTDSFEGYEGTRINGQFGTSINGSVAIFKIRDKTLQVFVDNQEFMNDFNNTVIKSLTYEL